MDLKSKKCVPCEGGIPPFARDAIQTYLGQIHGEWQVIDDQKIQRTFRFKNFQRSMEFVNSVAEIAENEGHHPDIHISYNRVIIELMTHAIKGLSENDFILAAKIDHISVKS